MALTEKSRLFVEARKAGMSNTQAAVKAGYSAKTACPAGSRLAKHPAVMAALAGTKAASTRRKGRAKPVAEPATMGQPLTDLPTTVSVPEADRPAKRYETPKEYLLDVMNDVLADPKLRQDAAKALLPYFDKRAAEAGKKEDQGKAAKVAGAGRFAPAAPPRLVANNP